MDLCELDGNHYLIIVEYFSNFIAVVPVKKDTRTSTILIHSKRNVARYGIMDTIISDKDNDHQFTNSELRDIIKK
ncbi:hypothetical protein DPMN_121959 [Dreissena polymorpha]|uniref:Integrase catalytic domain-containing protein n=1 Tax=Dreissena polymorpha TaxID=45954 RepID=A0A9D4GRL9_DREPO|nr:hypothetical protein DPMN_121959 [Dreissena polymorpha]